jgi:hypothetical protein
VCIDKQVWESREAVESTPRLPEPSTSSSIARFSSSTTDNNPQYFNDYQYDGQAQPSDPIDGLAQEISRTSLGGQTRAAATNYTSYNVGSSSSGYQVAGWF